MRISDWSSDVCSSDLGQFARRVIAQRLREYGYSGESQGALAIRISDFFEEIPRSALGDRETEFALRDGEGPHLRRLRGQLSEASRQGTAPGVTSAQQRSEEHTSELQSLMRISYAVFCLKKKKPQQ